MVDALRAKGGQWIYGETRRNAGSGVEVAPQCSRLSDTGLYSPRSSATVRQNIPKTGVGEQTPKGDTGTVGDYHDKNVAFPRDGNPDFHPT